VLTEAKKLVTPGVISAPVESAVSENACLCHLAHKNLINSILNAVDNFISTSESHLVFYVLTKPATCSIGSLQSCWSWCFRNKI